MNCLTIGYIISRIENNDQVCDGCINSVCSSKPLKTDYSTFVQIKEYKTGCLKYVTEECFQFFLSMEKMFRKCTTFNFKQQEGIIHEEIRTSIKCIFVFRMSSN